MFGKNEPRPTPAATPVVYSHLGYQSQRKAKAHRDFTEIMNRTQANNQTGIS
jgi:hypothetical protein